MSSSKRQDLAWLVAIVALVAVATGALVADTPRLRAFAGGPAAEPLAETLPAVAVKRLMRVESATGTPSLSILSFDDGTCESGLGASQPVTDLHEFDVPTQCIQSGLDIVGLTARMNTGSATAFAYAQAGPTPPGAGSVPSIPLAPPILGIGACSPAGSTTVTSRVIGPGAAVITGTANFFAGMITPNGFAGRDTNGPVAGRMWINCGGCPGMTQYSPTDLSNIGLAGNWMIRVTVEDKNCVPVELMGFSIE